MRKKLIKQIPLQLNTFAVPKSIKNWKIQLQIKRKHLQSISLIKDLDLEYMSNS